MKIREAFFNFQFSVKKIYGKYKLTPLKKYRSAIFDENFQKVFLLLQPSGKL